MHFHAAMRIAHSLAYYDIFILHIHFDDYINYYISTSLLLPKLQTLPKLTCLFCQNWHNLQVYFSGKIVYCFHVVSC